MLGAVVLVILMFTIAKNDLFSLWRAAGVVLVCLIVRYGVRTFLVDLDVPQLLAVLISEAVGLLPLYGYLAFLGYDRALILKIIKWYVAIGISLNVLITLMTASLK